MEIRTYDPRSMEPLLYNLSYPVEQGYIYHTITLSMTFYTDPG